MNILRCTAIITHHTAGLDKLGSLNSEGSGAQVRWAAPEQRCCTGTPSKIHPSTHAMKLTAWARLVAPATRAGRCSCSWSCTRWSAALSCGAHLGIVGRTKRAARSSRQLDGYTHTCHAGVPSMELAAAGDGRGSSQHFRAPLDLHQHPVRPKVMQRSGAGGWNGEVDAVTHYAFYRANR